jgi:hypothetical protein
MSRCRSRTMRRLEAIPRPRESGVWAVVTSQPSCVSEKMKGPNLSLAGASATLRPSLAPRNRSECTWQAQRSKLQLRAKSKSHGRERMAVRKAAQKDQFEAVRAHDRRVMSRTAAISARSHPAQPIAQTEARSLRSGPLQLLSKVNPRLTRFDHKCHS